MRVILDTNIFISYLLYTDVSGPIQDIFNHMVRQTYTLLLPQEVLTELLTTIAKKDYLSSHIQKDEIEKLSTLLETVADQLPPLPFPIPQVTRDPKDDFLLAHAVVAQADYLVSGDDDLLVMEKVERTTIISPADFVIILTTE